MIFLPDPDLIFSEMKKICERHGMEGIAPLDNQIGLEGIKPGKDLILKIVQADFDLMDEFDGGVFCLDPFRRSTEMDPGTAVEIGYMKALKKPMSGWTTDMRLYPNKIRDHFDSLYSQQLTATMSNDKGGTSGLFRDSDGILVHSHGMYQNGMTQGGIELSGGKVFAARKWQTAFNHAAANVAQQLQKSLLEKHKHRRSQPAPVR